MIYAVLFSFCTDYIQTDAIIEVENVNLFTRVNQTIRGQDGCLCIFFNKSHNWQITLCTNTDFNDICSFSLFGEKVFLILDFKNSTFCHRGARQRSKHDVKMTHAQFIEISYLYTRSSLLCLSPYNLKWHYTTCHLICSHLSKNHK